MFLLYNLLLTVLAPIWAPFVLLRSLRRKEQPNWAERQGNFPFEYRKGVRRIWLHAVSVGEVMASLPILAEVRKRLPNHEIVLTVTTSSGHRTAREKAQGLYDHLAYFPIDVARFQLAAMTRVRPEVVAIMETELWMNFVWAADVMGAETLLVNGRISDRSYPRARAVRFFYATLLSFVDRCLMQSDRDVARITELGAKHAEALGNCKFDQAVEALSADAGEWRVKLGLDPDRPVIVVGSTRGPEEEAFVLEALSRVGFDRIQVVHAPRHLERVAELSESVRGATGGVALRSKGESGPYLVLDTYGELASAYSAADIAIVGGGFENLGGQNIIQPLAHGVPVLHGPHMQNFRDVAEMANEAGAAQTCATPSELAEAVERLLGDPNARRRMGEAASALVRCNLGASARYADAIAAAAARAETPRRKR